MFVMVGDLIGVWLVLGFFCDVRFVIRQWVVMCCVFFFLSCPCKWSAFIIMFFFSLVVDL